jgi:hypothetical protein
MGKYESIIGIAGMMGLVSFGSLLIKIFQTHNTTSLPWTWILVNMGAQGLSIIYGVANKSIGITIPCALFVLGLLYIAYVKLNHVPYEKDMPKQL